MLNTHSYVLQRNKRSGKLRHYDDDGGKSECYRVGTRGFYSLRGAVDIRAFVGASPRDHRGDGGDGGEECPYPPQPRDNSATRPRRRGDLQAAFYLVVGQQHGSGACQRGVCQVAAWGDVDAFRQELRPRASTPN